MNNSTRHFVEQHETDERVKREDERMRRLEEERRGERREIR